jgi:hypothetical protein
LIREWKERVAETACANFSTFSLHLVAVPACSISNAGRKEFEMSAKGLALAAAVALLGFGLAGCVDGGPYYGAYTYSDYYGPYPGYYGGVVYSGGYYGGYYRHYRHHRHHRHHRHWRHGSGHHWSHGSRHHWRGGGHHRRSSASYNRSGSHGSYRGGSHHGHHSKNNERYR